MLPARVSGALTSGALQAREGSQQSLMAMNGFHFLPINAKIL
jgi:hypothetical protein